MEDGEGCRHKHGSFGRLFEFMMLFQLAIYYELHLSQEHNTFCGDYIRDAYSRPTTLSARSFDHGSHTCFK